MEEIEELIGITGIHRMKPTIYPYTNGYESVASMIVYEDGKPKRNKYRKFRLSLVKGPDDYASMREVLTRNSSRNSKNVKSLIWKKKTTNLKFQ